MNIVYIQWVAEAPLPASITWISLPNEVRLWLSVIASHLGNL
jgi:hypothetical protein